MEQYQRPDLPKLPKFEDEDEWNVGLDSDDGAQNHEDEDTEERALTT